MGRAATFLRQIPVGGRFLLLRTGEKFLRTNRHSQWGPSASNISVIRESNGQATILHHSCHVKPIIRLGQEHTVETQSAPGTSR